ncbi:hypothetical protein LY76DRAFT_499771 [Colletotrichum caudatum]|nr:hypothetical protein LY76DRAFT_499771 [Colletotrichum caudatum]
MQNGAGSPGVRRRRLSDGSRRDEAGREDSGRKRKRRILSCDTCRRQKCRCELEEESDVCARCRSLRFRSLEASIVELKATVQTLASGSRPDAGRTLATGHQGQQPQPQPQRQPQPQPQPNRKSVEENGNGDVDVAKAPGDEDVEPADRDVYLSPAEVIRKVGRQLSGGHRRTFDVQADVVSLGLLDEETAHNLLTEFVRRRRHTLLINSEVDLAPRSMGLRHASPFLFNVCCLHAMRFWEDRSSVLHRRIFERVRLQMGQLMIASPLPLEELMGILIMSLWASAPSGPEYIDSWLVSGHCAQQAMLSINFSEILSRTKSGASTEEDQRVMRLWANTCLVNLHWAATVPAAYLRQCKLLLDFEEVTMRDAMVYGEIMLYLILQDKFSQRLYLGSDGTCVELSAWRTRWNYLFELPAASTLRISYSIAWLILARRSLEHDQAAPDQDSLSSSPRLHPVDAAANDGARDQPGSQGPPDMAQSRVSTFATDVVRAFVDMPASRAEELPEFHRLCVAYAMLIISKHEQKPATAGGLSSDADDVVLGLLRAAQKHNGVAGNNAPSALQFGLERALKKVSSRIEARMSAAGAVPGSAVAGCHNRMSEAGLSSAGMGGMQPPGTAAAPTWSQTTQQPQRSISGQQHGQNPPSFTGETMAPDFDGPFSLETMDFFFSGGHLGLGDQSFF